MKKAANGNMYEMNAQKVLQSWAPYIAGSSLPYLCVLSAYPLPERAVKALSNSAEALGYGQNACSFISLNTSKDELSPTALFELIEGLDPLCLIAADAQATSALAAAYECKLACEQAGRIFGRDIVCFESFDAMLENERRKQQAWALLKKLPRKGAISQR